MLLLGEGALRASGAAARAERSGGRAVLTAGRPLRGAAGGEGEGTGTSTGTGTWDSSGGKSTDSMQVPGAFKLRINW